MTTHRVFALRCISGLGFFFAIGCGGRVETSPPGTSISSVDGDAATTPIPEASGAGSPDARGGESDVLTIPEAAAPLAPIAAGCPSAEPSSGARCEASTDTCLYGNGCGVVVAATCPIGEWSVTSFPCRTGCPSEAPAVGTPCSDPPPTWTCEYTRDPSCAFSCICEAGNWACFTTSCREPS